MESVRISQPKILLVDDDPLVRDTLRAILEMEHFEVSAAGNVPEVIHLIDTREYDGLLSDLHMPRAKDGFTVIKAMRDKHPDAFTLLFSGCLPAKEAMDANLLRADEIMMKPIPIAKMVTLIRDRLAKGVSRTRNSKKRVASILEQDSQITIAD
jgi:DNA-binding NtrC family response regulator